MLYKYNIKLIIINKLYNLQMQLIISASDYKLLTEEQQIQYVVSKYKYYPGGEYPIEYKTIVSIAEERERERVRILGSDIISPNEYRCLTDVEQRLYTEWQSTRVHGCDFSATEYKSNASIARDRDKKRVCILGSDIIYPEDYQYLTDVEKRLYRVSETATCINGSYPTQYARILR